MKTIKVVGAALIKDKRVFIAKRHLGGEAGGLWEFPGGKIEAGEDNKAAIERELREELSITVKAKECLGTVEYDYPSFHLSMDIMLCTLISGEIKMNEHLSKLWASMEELKDINWAPADVLAYQMVEKFL